MAEGIRRRGDRWQAYIDVNGRQVTSTFDTQAEAKRWRVAQQADLQTGDWIDPALARTRLDRWMRTWLELKKPTLAEGSWRRYESVVRNHVDPALGHFLLAQVDTLRVQRWVNSMEPSAAHSNLPVLRAALSRAVKEGLIRRNPASMVDMPSYSPERMTFLEPDELRDLLADEELEQWQRDILLGLAFTGARVMELAAVTPEHVNPLKGTIDLYATKTSEWRTISIAEPLREVVERRLAIGGEHVWEMEGARGRSQINPANLRNRTWYPLLERNGIEDVRLHDLRHTCASWLIRAGHNPVQVCAWMGHSRPTQTLDTYAHLFRTDMGDMAEALASMWDEPPASNVVPLGEVGS